MDIKPLNPETAKVISLLSGERTTAARISEFFGVAIDDFDKPAKVKAAGMRWLPILEQRGIKKADFDKLCPLCAQLEPIAAPEAKPEPAPVAEVVAQDIEAKRPGRKPKAENADA